MKKTIIVLVKELMTIDNFFKNKFFIKLIKLSKLFSLLQVILFKINKP